LASPSVRQGKKGEKRGAKPYCRLQRIEKRELVAGSKPITPKKRGLLLCRWKEKRKKDEARAASLVPPHEKRRQGEGDFSATWRFGGESECTERQKTGDGSAIRSLNRDLYAWGERRW